MAQTIVGIDLGSYSVKVCQLERSLRDFELVAFHEQVVTQGTRLSREEAVATALKSILERNSIPLDSVVVNIPAHHLSCRVLELPFNNIKKIEQTIDFELENFIPLPLEDLLVDYHILSIEQERSTVLTAYMPRVRFVKYLDALQAVGVDPRYIGVDSIDLSHIAQVAMVPQNGVYAIIDIGHEKTNICVMDGTKLQYVRSVTVGGLHFTKILQKVFKLNFEKADSLKQDRGKVSYNEEGLDQVSRNLKSIAEELVAFIRQTYMGYKQMYSNQAWGGIYLCGGGSKLNGLAEMISSAMRMNVVSLDCLDFVNHHIQEPDSCREAIPTSFAETLKVIFSNKAVKINFRRGEFAFKRDIKALGGEIKQAAFLVVLVFLLGLFHFGFSYYTLQSRIKSADGLVGKDVVKQLPEFKSSSGSAKKLLSSLSSKMSELQTELDLLNPAAQARVLPLLLEISTKIPSREEVPIDVDDFSFTGDHVRIEGRTNSFEAVDKIKNSIGNSGYFKNVVTQNVSKGVRDEIKFSLSMDVVAQPPSNSAPADSSKSKDKDA